MLTLGLTSIGCTSTYEYSCPIQTTTSNVFVFVLILNRRNPLGIRQPKTIILRLTITIIIYTYPPDY